MPDGFDELNIIRVERLPLWLGFTRQIDGEPLPGDGMTIFQPRITDSNLPHAREAGQLSRHVFSIQSPLLYEQANVLTFTARRKTEFFNDAKVFGTLPNDSRCLRLIQ